MAYAFIGVLIAFLVYLPALKNGFVGWDDSLLVYENPSIRSIDSNLARAIFSTETNPTLVPFTLFSYALDYAVWGLNPLGYHLTNIIVHALNTALVFILTICLIRCGTHPSSFIPAFVTALLFGIHPLNAEAVNWVPGRCDLLSAFFFLLSLISYLRFLIQSSGRNIFYCLSLLSFLVSLMSKPTSVSLPLILMVLDLYLLKSNQIKEALINKIPFFLLSLLSVVATLWYRQSHEVYTELGGFPLVMRLFIAVQSFMFYLYKMALPFNLAPYYPYPKEIDLLSQGYLVSLILLTSLTVFCIRGLKRRTLYSGVWLCYIISISPMVAPLLGFYKIGGYAEADRYAYMASIGPFMLAGVAAARIARPKLFLRNLFIAIMGILVLLLSIMTVGQTSVWQDSISLWSHEIRIFPEVSLSYYNRGTTYSGLGEYEKALRDLSRTVEINPEYTEAFNNLCYIHNELGDHTLALKECERAIELDPQSAEAFNNRGVAYDGLERHGEAIGDFDRAIRLNPLGQKTFYNRGNALRRSGNYREAVTDYNRAIELNPEDAKVYNNRGAAYSAQGEYQAAISDFSKALELNPSYSEAYNNRGTVHFEMKDRMAALKDFKAAVVNDPRYGSAYFNLGLLYLDIGNTDEAIRNMKTAGSLGIRQAQEYLAGTL